MSLWLSIFSLPRAQINWEGESCSHVIWLSLQAAGCHAWSCQRPRRRSGHDSRCWRPSGLCPFWVAPECSLLASGKRGSGYRDSTCGIQVLSRCYRCAGLCCTLPQQANEKKHSWLMKSFRADKTESWPRLEKGCACCEFIAVPRAGASGGTALGCCSPSCDLSCAISPCPTHMENMYQWPDNNWGKTPNNFPHPGH